MRKLLSLEVLLSFFLVAITAQAFAAEPEATANPTVVKIGVIAPLTGGLAMRGQDLVGTAEIVIEHLNARSEKYRFELIAEDGRCGKGNVAVTAARKLIDLEGIEFLITGCSGETLQVGPIAQRAGVLTFAVLATHQDIKKLGDFVFRTFVDIERGLESFSKRMAKEGQGRVAMLTEENAYNVGIKLLVEKQISKSIIFSEDFAEDMSDFKTILARVKTKKPKALFFNSFSAKSLANLVNQTRRAGLSQPIYANLQAGDPVFRKIAGEDAEGIVYFDTPSGMSAPEEFFAILKEYSKKHSGEPSYEFVVRTTYDALVAMTDGIEAMGSDPLKVRDYLCTYEKQGALGLVSFDENGDIKGIDYVVKQIVHGEPKNL